MSDVLRLSNNIAIGSKRINGSLICPQSKVTAGKLPTDGDEEAFASLWDKRY